MTSITKTTAGYPEANKLTLENPAFPDYGIERQKRTYHIGTGAGRFGSDAFAAALVRAADAEPLPSSDITGDAWDAAALVISCEPKRDSDFQAALAQLARELTVAVGRSEATSEGDVFLKLMLLARWLQQPELPFSTEITSFLSQMIVRDADDLSLDLDRLRADAEKRFSVLVD